MSFLFTDARNKVKCPKCGAEKGEWCRRPSGRKATEPHTERLTALQALPDFNIEDYQAKPEDGT